MKVENIFSVEIAGIKIKIIDNNKSSRAIINDLEASLVRSEFDSDIVIDITKEDFRDYKAEIFSAKGNMNFNESEYFVNYLTDLSYLVKINDKTKNINIKIKLKKKAFTRKLKSFILNNKDFSKNTILSYSLFWYIFSYVLSKKNKTFIHAGVFQSESGATLISGTGGCGKTSTLFKILEDTSMKYISEDFGIIDSEGYCYYNPKPVSIYSSDMEFGQTILKNHYKSFKMIDKLIWSLKRSVFGFNPMIKVNPRILMTNRISKKAKIKNVLYFIRCNQDSLKVEVAETNELIERILDSSLRELKTFNELLLLIRANSPISSNIPSFESFRLELKKIYLKSFSHTINRFVFIPHKTSPDVLVSFLKDRKLI